MRSSHARRTSSVLAASICAVVAIVTAAPGCGGPTEPVYLRPPEPPAVEESYELGDENRPLTEVERAERLGALDADPQGFVDAMLAAKPVRQAELLFVLQQRPEIARQRRDTIEGLAKSDHGVVRRAASFALDSLEEPPSAP